MAAALREVKQPGDPAATIAALDALVARTPDDEIQTSPTKFELIRDQGDEAAALAYAEKIYAFQGTDPYWPLNLIAWKIVDPSAKIKPSPAMLAFALKAAQRARLLATSAHPDIDDTLATALFATGDIASAINTEERAVSMANDTQLPTYTLRLAGFRAALTSAK